MGKKQSDDTKPDGEALEEIVEDAGGQAIWTLLTWQTLPLWRCSLCGWDTLDGENAMIAHYLATHAPPPPPAPAQTITIYDRYGRPV